MKRFGLVVAFGIMLLLCVSCTEKEKQNADISTAPKIKTESKVDAFGTVNVRNTKNITIDFPAIVEKIPIKEGSRVKKGDVLVSLNLSEFKKQISDKEYELNSAKIELSKTKAGIDWLKNNISEKQKYLKNNTDPELKKLINDVKYAKDSYKKALGELKKKRSLLEQDIIAQNDFDDFKETVDSKNKAVEDAEENVKITRYNRQKEIDELQSQLNQKMNNAIGVNSIELLKEKIAGIESDIKIMKDKLSKSYIKENNIVSDIENGVIYNLGYVEGDSVNGSKKLLSIMDTGSIFINADVDEEFIKDVKVGANVKIKPTADKSRQYRGKVVKILGNAIEKDDETSVPVEIDIQDKDVFLVPNFNVDIEIEK